MSDSSKQGWTQSHIDALLYLPLGSSLLSIVGSSLIIGLVVRGKKLLSGRPSHRFLFGISVNDLPLSFWGGFGPTLVREYGQPLCRTQGFFNVVALAVPIYQMALSFYYLLSIRYNVSDERTHKRYENWFHAAAFLFPWTTASIALGLNLYHPVFVGCHIEPYPTGYLESSDYECTKAENARAFQWLFVYAPISIIFAVIFVCQVLIYTYVRKTILESNKYEFRVRSDSTRDNNGNAAVENRAGTNSSSSTQRGPQQSSWRMAGANQSGSSRRNNSNNAIEKAREVAQSMCYVLFYFICLVFPAVLPILRISGVSAVTEVRVFPLHVVIVFVYPLQGFFNAVI